MYLCRQNLVQTSYFNNNKKIIHKKLNINILNTKTIQTKSRSPDRLKADNFIIHIC